jgi:hypothetical protein
MSMFGFGFRLGSSGVAAGLILSALVPLHSANAQDEALDASSLPNFAGSWTRRGDTPSTFEMPDEGPHTIDTAIPHYGHCVVVDEGVFHPFACPEGVTENRESNPWIADTSNPILQDWTREALAENRAGEEAGIPHLSFQQNCKPSGVPQIMNLRYQLMLLQDAGQTTVLYENNQQMRRVYMNEEHPEDLPRTWYGHSVGHYEGDELVVDTIAQVDFTELDRFGTLHTDALHVVERYKLLDPNTLQIIFTVEDQKAFTMPWRGVATYRRTDYGFPEFICAENNRDTMADQRFAIPTELTPNF